MITEQQRKERIKSIGSSECAAVLGLSRWDTPLGVWSIKTGQVIPEDISDKLAVQVGTELEDLVGKLFTKATGKKVHRVNETLYHKEFPFISANLDRRIVGEDALLEAKTCSGWKAHEWATDEIPQEYLLQVYHQLAVTGKKYGYIAVLIGGNQAFRWKMIPRDEKIIGEIIAKEKHFWETFVVPKVMPTTITKNDADTLYKLFPETSDEEAIELDDEAEKLIESRQALLQDLKVVQGEIDRTGNELKALLKDHEIGVSKNYKISWKGQSTTRLDSKRIKTERPEIAETFSTTTKTRVLRVSKLKKKGGKNG